MPGCESDSRRGQTGIAHVKVLTDVAKGRPTVRTDEVDHVAPGQHPLDVNDVLGLVVRHDQGEEGAVVVFAEEQPQSRRLR